ncbi:MAG: hypothetical protein CMM61_16530 [Rhodospirillaceae bacterium]|nr:hypothetical protein [Rhodospirillaceae bacterium]|tara:strand:- start:203 stop:601 length:399 start_codon:yes stop_codon:yes gene_type:complete
MTFHRRQFTAGLVTGLLAAFVLATAFTSGPAAAHHGWRWAEDGNFEITGIVMDAKMGNPHGIVTLKVEGHIWLIEVGQPWRNERAGLTDGMLKRGMEVTFSGARAKDHREKRLKAERVIINGTVYNLYPDRD